LLFAKVNKTSNEPYAGLLDDVRVYDHALTSNEIVTVMMDGTISRQSPRGVPYTWYNAYGITNNYAQADDSDPDGDGMKTWEEYIAGTDPTSSVSCLRAGIVFSNNSVLVRYDALLATGTGYDGMTARKYSLESATQLPGVIWQGVANETNITGNNSTVVYTNSVLDASRFFRVKAKLQ
jgi:hypothetical protein